MTEPVDDPTALLAVLCLTRTENLRRALAIAEELGHRVGAVGEVLAS